MTCWCDQSYDFFYNYDVSEDGLTFCGGCGAFYYQKAIFVWRDDA